LIRPGPRGIPSRMSDPSRPAILDRLERRRATHRDHGRVYRVAWVIAGSIIVLAGAAMIALPGPAFIVIPVGLAMLSFEFCWAQRLLDKGVSGGAEIGERVRRADPATKRLGLAGLALAALAIVALVAIVVT
jgi:uncharacterized protein (TIGR02611 family)